MSGGELFRIGEVARLFHLSVSTLRHYERLGLVTPERVDPDTGYRYYSARQFEALNTVRYLRALDMPLEEISDFVHNRTWTTSRPSCANSGRPWPESGRSWSGCSGRSTPAWSSWRRPATASWTTSVWWRPPPAVSCGWAGR